MNLILAAIPLFILLILVEMAISHRRGAGVYRLNDAVASMSTGILSQTMGFATRFAGFFAYATLWQVLPHGELTMSPLLWVVAFVLYDLCYYWNHRAQHSINVLWGIHVVHHQSEEYNLTTALRQPFNGFLVGSLFYLPMLFIGFPPEVVVTVGSLNLIYQYWVHTRLIGTLGWMEKVFVTPMNHRVHHAINDPYIDRNYGGVFILWDRFFGTYQAELPEQPCAYGVRKALHSWNPFLPMLRCIGSCSRTAGMHATGATNCASGSCRLAGARQMWPSGSRCHVACRKHSKSSILIFRPDWRWLCWACMCF